MDTIEIGRILKPQGIKGEVKVLPITFDVNRFKGLKSLLIDDEEYSVKSVKIREDGVYISFEGIGDRNDAEGLRNKYLCVTKDQAVELPKDCWFIADLLGCKVWDDAGLELGTVSDVLQNGCADVYCLDGGKVMFPALKNLLKSVDTDTKRIVVDSAVLNEVAVYEN